MRYRPLLAVIATVCGAVLTGSLIKTELSLGPDKQNRIAPTEAQHKLVSRIPDKLASMRFLPAEREANFTAFGLDPDQVSAAEREARSIAENHRERIEQWLDVAEDREGLQHDLCTTDNALRPRYNALRWLILTQGEERMVLTAGATQTIKPQPWAATSTVAEIYDRRERVSSPPDDAPRMVVAAVLANKEESALRGLQPWGNPDSGGWSWKEVDKRHPGISAKVVKYFALFHVVKEIADSDGGLCR